MLIHCLCFTIKVCKRIFLLTLAISYEVVEGAKKTYDTDCMRLPRQKQSGGQNRTPVEVKERVRDHILSYPRVRTQVKSL